MILLYTTSSSFSLLIPSNAIPGTIFSVSATFVGIEVGYNGQIGVNYRKRKLTILNNCVLTGLVRASCQSILSFWAKVDCGKLSGVGESVEELFWADLSKSENVFCMEAWKLHSGTKANEKVQKDKKPSEAVEDMALGVLMPDLDSKKVYRMGKGCHLIDNVGSGYRVHRLTVGDDHSMRLNAMPVTTSATSREEMMGVLLVDRANVPASLHKLEFYWVIPHGQKEQWINKAPKKYNKQTKRKHNETEEAQRERENLNTMKDVVNACLTEHVQQFVLTMEEKFPAHNA